MADAQDRLTPTQVRDAGLTDWRQLAGRLKARFRTGDFAAGLALVNRIGAVAEAANHHPDVQLTYTDVIVTLSSHDVGGLTQLELGLDTADDPGLAPFYPALLGSTVQNDEPVDPTGQVPTLWWQEPGRPDHPHALPPQAVPQRWHLDVWVAPDEGEPRLRAALEAGGRLVSDRAAPAYWGVEDADGNRSCICTAAGR